MFPTWTALAGIALAALIFLGRERLSRDLPRRPAEPAARWEPRDVALVLALIGLGLGMRLIGLESRPIDNDEPVGLAIGSLGTWARETDARLHPPLPSLLMAWSSGGADVWRARGISVVAGTLTIALAFAAARRCGRGAALLSGVWMALAPAALHTSQLARGYALLTLLVMSSHLLLDRALADGRSRWFFAYAASAALALSCEYLAILPLAAEALIACKTGSAFERVNVVGSLGAALCAVAFMAPFAWPTLISGIGGGPSGPWQAFSDIADLFSGVGAPFNAILGGLLVAVAARRGALRETEQRLAWAMSISVVAVMLVSPWMAVRARYVLHAFPMFVVLVSVSALRLGQSLGRWIAAGLAASHLALVPGYFSGRAHGAEIGTGRRTPTIYGLLRSDPAMPVAVTPEWAIAEPGYRLTGRFPGPDAGLDCPAVLCLRTGTRRVYGVRSDSVARLLAQEPKLYLMDRFGTEGEVAGCAAVIHEGSTTLLLCAREKLP